MKTILFLLIISFSSLTLSSDIMNDCIQGDLEAYLTKKEGLENIYIKKYADHSLVFSEDSCGAKGCEIQVFSEVTPFCTTETLTVKGFYINGSLATSSVEIKTDGQVKKYRYFTSEAKFK